jgi:hypothetical protein
MIAKTFSVPFASQKSPAASLEDDLNEWLADPEQAGVQINEVVPIHTEHFAILVVLYFPGIDEPGDLRKRPKEVLCGQCKKNPAIPGLKVCPDCRQYQKEYREKRKQEKKENRYP